MISKYAVEQFLARQLDEWEWIKSLVGNELFAELGALEPPPTFYRPLREHQYQLFLLGARLEKCLFFADMGTGKTAVVLTILAWLKQAGYLTAGLVVVPNLTNITGWGDEIKLWAPNLKPALLIGSSTARLKLIEAAKDPDLYIINYAGLVSLFTYREYVPHKKKTETFIDDKKLNAFLPRVNCCIFDESQKIKSHASWSYRLCNRISNICDYRYALTGTPTGRDPQDLWSQFFAIDKGATLGTTLGMYRAAFFKPVKNRWSIYPDYKLNKTKEKKLHQVMQHSSLTYTAAECGELPPLTILNRHVDFPQSMYSYYKQAVMGLRAKRQTQDVSVLDNEFLHMRMMASSFVQFKREGKQELIEFDETPKLDELFELLDDIPATSKVVVFHEFTHTGKMITAALKKKKIKHLWLYGGTKTVEKPLVVQKFTQDPSIRVLVCNSQSGGTGTNLQVANYQIIYELPIDPIIHAQVIKRCHRLGQEKPVFLIYLLMRRSSDARQLAILKEGKQVHSALVLGDGDLVDENFF